MTDNKSGTTELYECDALVVGTGCAGLSAAVTGGHHGLKVLVVEKEQHFGGTTARSGGWLWIPGTSLEGLGHCRNTGPGAHLSQARSRQQL
jgi:succinate dehydrogenase/fumarate reductase flavoprotein subunit